MDNDALSREILANMELQRQGSVMAKDRQQVSPLVGTIGDLLNALNPINWMGGMAGSGAAIAPTNNKILQGLLQALETKAPKLVERARGLSETVFPYLVPRETMPDMNMLGGFRKVPDLPKGEIYLRGGRPQAEQIDTLGHELAHFNTAFNPARPMNPEHQLETAQQLTNMMPPGQRQMMQNNYLPSNANTPEILMNLRRMKPGTSGPASTAYDEAISYLTESLMQGNRGGDSALESVANALGVGIR